MKESFFGLGLAFVCNFDGKVIDVAWDDFGLHAGFDWWRQGARPSCAGLAVKRRAA